MDISGSRHIPAPPAAVWAGLGDPAILKACIAGCERLDKTADDGFEGVVSAKVGPLKGAFEGRLTVISAEAPRRCALALEAQDPKAGGGRASGEVTIEDAEGGSTLSYTGEVEAEGKIGQLGSRLVTGFARTTIDGFLARFAELAAEGRLSEAAQDAPEPPPLADAPPLAPEEPDVAPVPADDAPPIAPTLDIAKPIDPTPIAPTATPLVPEPAAIAAEATAASAEKRGRPAIAIMLVAAIVAAAGVAAYWFMMAPSPV